MLHDSLPICADYQGGERLGGETSGSERKCVMQWTGTERGIFYPCIVVYNLKMFWSR